MKQITLNGKTLQTPHSTLELLLNDMELLKGRFAVEVDGELIPKSQLANFPLKNGMIIEIVQAVGGG